MSFLININKEDDDIVFYFGRHIWKLEWNDSNKEKYPTAEALFEFFTIKVREISGVSGVNILWGTEPLAIAVINKLVQW